MSVRCFIAGLLLSLVMAAHAQPTEVDIATYRAKLAEYVAKTDDVDAILSGLRGWFGWPFLAYRDTSNGTIDFMVRAPVYGDEIRYLRVIGSVRVTSPNILIELQE